MKEFPSSLDVANKENFPEMNYNRLKCYLRREIFEHVISHSEEEYFDLDVFTKRVNNLETCQKMLKELAIELEKLGWHCKLCFGDTGMFIYSTENPPKNCWE